MSKKNKNNSKPAGQDQAKELEQTSAVGGEQETADAAQEEYVTSTAAADLLADVIAGEKAEKDKPSEENTVSDDDTDTDEGSDVPKKNREHKKLKHGMMSTIYTIAFVAVIVLVNIIATILFDKYPITFDLTKNNTYSISEKSEEYVKSIDTEVTFKIFAEEDAFTAINDYSKQANEVMKKYSKYNSKISVEYIDIDSNPDIVGEYSDQSISTYDIVVESYSKDDNGNYIKDDNGDPIKRIRKVSLLELINYTDDFEEQIMSAYSISAADYALGSCNNDELTAFAYSVAYGIVESSNADQAFLSALMAVTDPDPVTVTIVTGRNETSELSYFQTLLLANGYTVNSIDIKTEDIPEDTDLCIVPAPQTDYLDTEIQKLSDYLDNDGRLGKNMIYMAAAEQQKTPNLDEFLAEYYVEIGDDIILENDKEHAFVNNMTGTILTMADDISESFTQDVNTENPQIAIAYSRPVIQLETEKGKIVTETYISSTDNAYLVNAQSGDTEENGKQVYAVMASKAAFNDDGTADYSNIFVCGTVNMFSDEYMMYTQFQNREYFLSVINGMTGKTTAGITIEPKVITGNIFDVNAKHVRNLKIIFIGVIPALTLVTGLVIWLRRKNR